jgi:uncharacterized phage protein (TIGR01671 family)
MNRTLKFRVWDVKDKKFLNPSDIAINGNGNLLITDSGWYENFENQNLSDYVVQQFTELYDNNKKPIYEGDRVRFGYSENHEFFGEVIYLEDRASFGVRYKNTFETLEDVPMDHMKYFEVIGNIFETENYKKVYSDDVKPSGKKYNSVSEIMKDLKNGK